MKSVLLDENLLPRFIRTGIVKALVTVALAVQLVACGGGGGGSDSASGASSTNVTSNGSTPGTSNGTNSTTNSNSNSNASSTTDTGSLSLNWVAPITRVDGAPLSLADIDGFRIHYGNSTGNYTNHVNVADGTAQKVTLNNLAVGTYYIVMTSYDINGLESSYSVVIKKTVS
jgi:hypothetical protein